MKVMASARWVCADVFQEADENNMFVMKTMIKFTGPALKGYVLLVGYFQCTAEPRHRDLALFTLPQITHTSLNLSSLSGYRNHAVLRTITGLTLEVYILLEVLTDGCLFITVLSSLCLRETIFR